MGSTLNQPSFVGGELAPSLYGRVDLARYQTALKTCRNFISRQYGGVDNRPGTRFVAATKQAGKAARLIPFAFSTVQTYALEFGDGYMRVYKDGAQVVYPVGHASAGQPVEVVTPYAEADLFRIKYTQSADVLTLVHPNYPPKELKRFDHHVWTLTDYVAEEGPFKEVNFDKVLTVQASAVTGSVTMTASTDIFLPAHVGTLFYIGQADSNTPAWQGSRLAAASGVSPDGLTCRSNGKTYIADGNPAIGSKGYWTGTSAPSHDDGTEMDGLGTEYAGSPTGPMGVKWKYLHSGYGIVKITGYTDARHVTATVTRRLPESVVSAATYRWAHAAWSAIEGYPGAVGYFQQRMVFAGSKNAPQTVWLTAVGAFHSFGKSVPTSDDDAISRTLVSRQVNEIRHVLPLNSLVLLTSGGEWVLSGPDDVLSPKNVSTKQQGYNGSSHLAPVVSGISAIYMLDDGGSVQDLAYTFQSDGFDGDELSTLSNHLLTGRELVDWFYAKKPFTCVWCVRDDGVLLGLTYMQKQQVIGWHRHDTDGVFESVCSIREGKEDAVYTIVQRTVNGALVRYVERFASRQFDDISDAYFVDSGLSYDGRNTGSTTLTISGGTTWDYRDDTFTVTASTAYFNAGMVGAELHLPYGDGLTLKVTIDTYTSDTVVSGLANRNVPAELQNAAVTNWSLARKSFAGLGHLEGKTVSILADGNVHPQRVVTAGAIELQYAAAVVHAGLPYVADFETLDINLPSGETLRDKKKVIPRVTLLCQASRALFAGTSFAERDLYEVKQRDAENYDQAIFTKTGLFDVSIPDGWNTDGRVCVRQSDPLPLSILAVMPDLTIGGA